MQQHTLKKKTKNKKAKQVGRGGKHAKTSGRGTKGQNARAGHKKRPESRDFIKRIPKLRGRGVSPLKVFRIKAIAVNLSLVNDVFEDGDTVSIKTLKEKKVASIKKGSGTKFKILGTGEITKKLIFEGVEISESAKAKIIASGGNIK